MLAPHRLFNSIIDLVEHRCGEGITQHLLDTLNKTIEKMVEVYVDQYGYTRPSFQVIFHTGMEHTVAICGMNDYAERIIQEYYAEDETGTPG